MTVNQPHSVASADGPGAKEHKGLLVGAAAMMTGGVLTTFLSPLLAVSFAKEFGFGVEEAGLLVSGGLGGVALSAFAILPFLPRLDRRMVGISGALVAATGLAVTGLATSFVVVLALQVLIGLGAGLCYACANSALAYARLPERAFSIVTITWIAIHNLESALSELGDGVIITKTRVDGTVLPTSAHERIDIVRASEAEIGPGATPLVCLSFGINPARLFAQPGLLEQRSCTVDRIAIVGNDGGDEEFRPDSLVIGSARERFPHRCRDLVEQMKAFELGDRVRRSILGGHGRTARDRGKIVAQYVGENQRYDRSGADRAQETSAFHQTQWPPHLVEFIDVGARPEHQIGNRCEISERHRRPRRFEQR